MKAITLAVIAAILPVAASAQQTGLQAQSATPGVGSANLPSTSMGMDSFEGVAMRSGDHGMSPAELRAYAEQSRAEALVWANRARQGAIAETYAAAIRDRLKNDLDTWRQIYSVRGSEYKAMVAQWLVDRDKLNATQWAEQRAAWYQARDAWVTAHGGDKR